MILSVRFVRRRFRTLRDALWRAFAAEIAAIDPQLAVLTEANEDSSGRRPRFVEHRHFAFKFADQHFEFLGANAFGRIEIVAATIVVFRIFARQSFQFGLFRFGQGRGRREPAS